MVIFEGVLWKSKRYVIIWHRLVSLHKMASISSNAKIGFCFIAAGIFIALLMYAYPEKLRVPP